MLFTQILMKAIIQLNGNRSISAIYHLITGRKSIQTKQDAYLFKLDTLYGVCTTLKKAAFDQEIRRLQQQEWITILVEERTQAVATNKGKTAFKQMIGTQLAYFNGKEYGRLAELYMQRLTLLIQTIANMHGGNHAFIPVVEDRHVLNWMRRFYATIKGKEFGFLEALQQELEHVLTQFPDREAGMFVDRLSGYQHFGLSYEQLAHDYALETIDAFLLLKAIQHRMLAILFASPDRYPILLTCASAPAQRKKLSDSAAATYEMLMQGLSAIEVTQMRRLKLNTIHDHIVEIALHDAAFSLAPYLSESAATEIHAGMLKAQSAKLKDIKQAVSDDIDYFQIRLALARMDKMQVQQGENHV